MTAWERPRAGRGALTAEAVMNGADEARKRDIRAWRTTVNPDVEFGGPRNKSFANTITIGTDQDPIDEKIIDTVFFRSILQLRDTNVRFTNTDGIPAVGGDPALLVLGAHELAHGSEGNRIIESDAESEADVRPRILDTIKSSPGAKDGVE